MSTKVSFEAKIMNFFVNASFERTEVIFGLIKEVYRQRKLQAGEEEARVSRIARHPLNREARAEAAAPLSTPSPARVITRRRRRTKAEIARALTQAQTVGGETNNEDMEQVRIKDDDGIATPPPDVTSA
jgi:hypothetical protein